MQKVRAQNKNEGRGVLLITGAAKRIGRALSIGLAQDGFDIVVHYHTAKQEAETLCDEISHAGGRALPLCADLTNETQLAGLIPQANRKMGRLIALINNAAIFEPDNIALPSPRLASPRPASPPPASPPLTQKSWDSHIKLNLKAPAFLSQDFARQLNHSKSHQAPSPQIKDGQTRAQTQTQDANIINIIDERVLRAHPAPHFLSYTISKSALWVLTQQLACSLAPLVRVNAIAPGPTLINARQSQEHFKHQASLTPLKAASTTADILQAVRFVLSAQALTGQLLAIDKGAHLTAYDNSIRE